MVGVFVERTLVAELSAMAWHILRTLPRICLRLRTLVRLTPAASCFVPAGASAVMRAKERCAWGRAVARARVGAVGSADP